MKSVFVVTLGVCVLLGAVAARPAEAQPGAPVGASVRDKQVIQAAKFAVMAQQKAMKADHKAGELTLVKIVSAKKQVVSGMSYELTLQVKVGKTLQTAEAKVWEQAWKKEPYKLVSWKFAGEQEAKDDQEAKKDEKQSK